MPLSLQFVSLWQQLLSKELPDAKVVEPTPGEPLDISIPVHGQ